MKGGGVKAWSKFAKRPAIVVQKLKRGPSNSEAWTISLFTVTFTGTDMHFYGVLVSISHSCRHKP
jgi:hypothetical protein